MTKMNGMTTKEYETRMESYFSDGVEKLIFMHEGQLAPDGWWTLRQNRVSSYYATKVSCTEWGHVVMVGDIVDIVIRGSEEKAMIRWLASSDLSYLASKCQIRGQAYGYSTEVAINNIMWHLNESDVDEESKEKLEEVLRIVKRDEGSRFPQEAEKLWYVDLGMEHCPGEVPSQDLILARLIARRMVKLWDEKNTKVRLPTMPCPIEMALCVVEMV